MANYFCELCHERATVYCCADEAYVCWRCDEKVHSANFIVARHFRSVLCDRCQAPTLTLAKQVNAPASASVLCPTCAFSPDLERLQLMSSESSGVAHSEHSSTIDDDSGLEEVSSAPVIPRKRRRCRSPSPNSVIPVKTSNEHVDHHGHKGTEERLEQVLEGWNRHLGLESGSAHSIICVAMQLLRRIAGSIKSNQLEKLDARSALAACLWISLKLDSSSRSALVRVDKFEKCTGISAEVVLCLEAKLCQACSSKWNLKSRVNLDLAL